MQDADSNSRNSGVVVFAIVAGLLAVALFFWLARDEQRVALVVSVDPAGATVRLVEPRIVGEYEQERRATNGEVTFPDLPANTNFRLSVSAKGFQQEVVEDRLPQAGTHKVSVKLKAESGLYTVRSNPEGALLYLDGKPAGIAPTVLSDVTNGPHELSAHLEGYEDAKKEFVAASGAHMEIEITLEPKPVVEQDAGPVDLDAIPDGWAKVVVTSTHTARFLMDNFVIGYGNKATRHVSPGGHRITARAEGRATKWEMVQFAEGETREVNFEFNEDPLAKAYDAGDPSKPIYWTVRGGHRRNEGKYGDAIDMFKKALELDPTDITSHRQLSRTYPALKMWKEASKHANKYLELSPGAPDEKFTRGLIAEFDKRAAMEAP